MSETKSQLQKQFFIKCESKQAHLFKYCFYIFIGKTKTNNLSKLTSLKNSIILKPPIQYLKIPHFIHN